MSELIKHRTLWDRDRRPHVRVPTINEAMRSIEDCYCQTQQGLAPSGLAIICKDVSEGSAALTQFVNMHRTSQDDKGETMPILLACVPENPTAKLMIASLLHPFGGSIAKGSSHEMMCHLQSQITRARTRLIILYGIETIESIFSSRDRYELGNCLRFLVKSTGVSLITIRYKH